MYCTCYAYMCICMGICMYVCLFSCVCVHVRVLYMCVHVLVYICIYMCVSVCVCVCVLGESKKPPIVHSFLALIHPSQPSLNRPHVISPCGQQRMPHLLTMLPCCPQLRPANQALKKQQREEGGVSTDSIKLPKTGSPPVNPTGVKKKVMRCSVLKDVQNTADTSLSRRIHLDEKKQHLWLPATRGVGGETREERTSLFPRLAVPRQLLRPLPFTQQTGLWLISTSLSSTEIRVACPSFMVVVREIDTREG